MSSSSVFALFSLPSSNAETGWWNTAFSFLIRPIWSWDNAFASLLIVVFAGVALYSPTGIGTINNNNHISNDMNSGSTSPNAATSLSLRITPADRLRGGGRFRRSPRRNSGASTSTTVSRSRRMGFCLVKRPRNRSMAPTIHETDACVGAKRVPSSMGEQSPPETASGMSTTCSTRSLSENDVLSSSSAGAPFSTDKDVGFHSGRRRRPMYSSSSSSVSSQGAYRLAARLASIPEQFSECSVSSVE